MRVPLESGAADAAGERRERRPRAQRTPLSHAQQRVWLFEQAHPGTSAYCVARGLRLTGSLDVAALRDAFSQVQQRHDALRTWFELSGGIPMQRVDAQPLVEIQSGGAPRSIDAVREEVTRAAAETFDLTGGPLLRARLYESEGGGHVLLLTAHELACDARSLDLVVDDLQRAYEQRIRGEFVDLGRGVAYGEYAESDAKRPHGAFADAIDSYRALLGDAPHTLELPLDRPRPAAFGFRGALVRATVDPPRVAELEQLAAAHEVTLEAVLLSAFQVLLARYSAQRDLVLGVLRGVRGADREAAVGCFTEVAPLRAKLDGEPSFALVLERTREALASSGGVPFGLLLEQLGVASDASRTPLVQALFAYRETANRVVTTGPLAWERIDVATAGTRTDVALLAELAGDRLSLALEYGVDALSEATARRMLASYELLLRGIVEHGSPSVMRLPLLAADEQRALDAINDTARPAQGPRVLSEVLRLALRQHASRVAVRGRSGSLTYAELDRRSDQLAALLAERGVGRGARVGVCLPRDLDMLSAVLAVLKVGAAYVPLDPELPRDRLEYIASDAELALVLIEQATAARLPEGLRALDVNEPSLALDGFTPVSLDGEDIAYVIYTSGSTGRPKGVQIPHRAVVNFLESMAVEPGCTADDVLLAVTTLSFDISVLELMLPLLVGARVVIATREQAIDGARLAELLREHAVTMLQATPTTWRILLDHGWLPRPGFKVLCGGEAFPPQLARELRRGTEEVWNMYGPTETTVWSTCARLADPEAPIMVGAPIANTQIYVLDANLERVPFGVQGELYIGGTGVAAGYLNRSELTAERFVADPFCAGARMYRTGDLARQWPHGLQIVGRTDHQVKLRGHRIELGEIESVLDELGSVRECAVVVREISSGDQRLLAFVVPAEGEAADPQALRARVRTRLPEYMVPQHFLVVAALPHTPNGKIDRNALVAPPDLTRHSGLNLVSAESALERLVLGVWQKVLRANDLGVTDSFFEVGGHSLLAVQLMRQLSDAVGTPLPLSLAFTAPTIREQAHFINSGRVSEGVSVVPLQLDGDGIPLFCICGINLYQALATALGDDRPVYGVFLPVEAALLAGKKTNLSVRQMARDYVAAIRSKQPSGPYNLAGVSFGGVLAYEVAQQLRAAGEEVLMLAILDVVLDEAMHLDLRAWTSAKWKKLTNATPSKIASRIAARVSQRAERRASGPARDNLELANQELARLDDLRQREYQHAWLSYKRTMQSYEGSVLVCRAQDQTNGEHGYVVDYDCGWSRYVRGTLWTCEVPGDHLGILDEPNVRVLADELKRKLRALAPECVRYSSLPPALPGLEVRPFGE